MQRQTITVLATEKRQSQNGKAFWRVRTDSGVYYVWDAGVAERLQPETTAVVSINGSSDYPRIVAVHEAPEPAEPASPPLASPAPPGAGDRERRMLRMSALRAAAEVLHGTGVPAGELVAYAETLLAWLEA